MSNNLNNLKTNPNILLSDGITKIKKIIIPQTTKFTTI